MTQPRQSRQALLSAVPTMAGAARGAAAVRGVCVDATGVRGAMEKTPKTHRQLLSR
jgi:hypothetical protein